MPIRVLSRLSVALIVVLMSACETKESTDAKAAPAGSTVTDPVLARVGDTEIRRSQLDVLIARLDVPQIGEASADLQQKMLQSLVRARALALAAERSMNGEERLEIEARVQAFRDELLAQYYLQNNVVTQPVDAAQVKDYYLDHLGKYTVPGQVNYEYFEAAPDKDLDDVARHKVIAAFAQAKGHKDWRAYAEELKRRGLPVVFKAAQLQPHLIANPLRAEVQSLQEGQTSSIIYGDRVMVARVVSREAPQVRPLHQVSAEIRKKLAPMQLKQALSESAHSVLQHIKVETLMEESDAG